MSIGGGRATAQPVSAPGSGFQAEIVVSGDKAVLTLEEGPDGGVWLVAEVDGARVSKVAAPRWIAAPVYRLSVERGDLRSGATAVVFRAAPGAGGPPAAPSFSAAWVVDAGAAAWRTAAAATYSELDGGSQLELVEEAGVARLIRRSADTDRRFCGLPGDSSASFDYYEPSRGDFVTAYDLDAMAKAAAELSVGVGEAGFEPPKLQGWVQWFFASSDALTDADDGRIARPLELGDRRLDTAWSAGAKGAIGGDFVTARLNDAVALEAIRIFPGDLADDERFANSRKPSRLMISLSSADRFIVALPHVDRETLLTRGGLTVTLPEPQETSCVTVAVLDARPASASSAQAGSVSISELVPLSTVHRRSPKETAEALVQAVAAQADDRRRQRLVQLGLTLQQPLVEAVLELLDTGSSEQRRRVVELLAHVPAELALPHLIDALRGADPGGGAYRATKRAIAAHGSSAATPLLAYVRSFEDIDSRKYVDAVRLLGRVGRPVELEGLLEDLGRGAREIRNERVRAVAKGGDELVDALFSAAVRGQGAARHDAFKALSLIGRRLHDQRPSGLAAPDTYLEVLGQIDARRTLMRALRIARYFRADGFVEAVSNTFARHPDPLVRREAIASLRSYPGEEAHALLEAALRDRSPDVRVAAVGAIGEREDAPKSVDELASYIERERWREGLRKAFGVLARIETPQTNAIFLSQLKRQPNADPTLFSLRALNRARRSLPAPDVVAALGAESPRLSLRAELVENLSFDDSEPGFKWLVATISRPASAAPGDRPGEVARLRNRAMMALGRRRSARGQRTLLKFARGAQDPDARRSAVRALSFWADAELLAELQRWAAEAPPEIRAQIRETMAQVEQRLTFKAAEEEVDRALDALESRPGQPLLE